MFSISLGQVQRGRGDTEREKHDGDLASSSEERARRTHGRRGPPATLARALVTPRAGKARYRCNKALELFTSGALSAYKPFCCYTSAASLPSMDYSKWDKLEVEDEDERQRPVVTRLDGGQSVTIGPSGAAVQPPSARAAAQPAQPSAVRRGTTDYSKWDSFRGRVCLCSPLPRQRR